MKRVRHLALTLFTLASIIVIYAVHTATSTSNPVGLQVVRIDSANGAIALALWYPTSATPLPTTLMAGQLLNVAKDAPVLGTHLPLVVLSHGNNGSALSHVDLAMELASAGYVVAALTHTGDNFADQSKQASPSLFRERAEQLRAVIDYVLGTWSNAQKVLPGRIGAYGFSAGGFTVLTLIGGAPNMETIGNHCKRSPEFICEALEQLKSPLLHSATNAGPFQIDNRIRAAVVAAPGLGFTFANGGLSDVHVPVQVWNGDRDETVPYATNTKIVQEGLGPHAEWRQLHGASHRSFLAPCGLLKPTALCSDPEGFDRRTAHVFMNAEIIHFFNVQLKKKRPTR